MMSRTLVSRPFIANALVIPAAMTPPESRANDADPSMGPAELAPDSIRPGRPTRPRRPRRQKL